jgi:CRISPR/Cas system-associated exonuclease Cas4 (RecB family)
MSEYYNPRRSRGLFDPESREPFKLSRSKIDLFLECPRCFYLDRRLGVSRPPGFPFNLNSAVDHLLKKEFDAHRALGKAHPLMAAYGLDAVPFEHERMREWRDAFNGVRVHHRQTNFLVFGAVDDIWRSAAGELIVVDYKATSKDSPVSLDAGWQIGYKRQMETYQWLLRGNGFSVSDTGYFVYANGKRDRKAFDARLEFDVVLLPYTGSDAWVEGTLVRARECLLGDDIPAAGEACDYCAYRAAAGETLLTLKRYLERKAQEAAQGDASRLF